MSISFSRTGQPVSEVRFAEVVGAAVPDSYRDFMLAQNGGVLDDSAHLPGDDSGASVRAFLMVDDPVGDGGYDLADFLTIYRGRYPEGFVPIGVDVSSNLILLDTGFDEPGSVWFWDHEGEADEDEPARTDNIVKIATSFSSFLADLTTGFTAEEEALIAEAVRTGTFELGTYKLDEPFIFD